jgi:hypothetical protein
VIWGALYLGIFAILSYAVRRELVAYSRLTRKPLSRVVAIAVVAIAVVSTLYLGIIFLVWGLVTG